VTELAHGPPALRAGPRARGASLQSPANQIKLNFAPFFRPPPSLLACAFFSFAASTRSFFDSAEFVFFLRQVSKKRVSRQHDGVINLVGLVRAHRRPATKSSSQPTRQPGGNQECISPDLGKSLISVLTACTRYLQADYTSNCVSFCMTLRKNRNRHLNQS
jgi:hypothetical protein